MDPAIAEEVLARSEGRCEGIGTRPESGNTMLSQDCNGRGEHFHHIHRRRIPDAAGVILHVCQPCHAFIHSRPLTAMEYGSLKPSWEDHPETQ